MCSTAMEAKEGHRLWDRFVLPVGKVKTQVEVESILIIKKKNWDTSFGQHI
jgi:hypothetical protein